MMKKKGFTLAEVLITLTIIGVVAVLTLPNLMANVNEGQSKTAFKKVVNTLSNAASLSDANIGLNFSNMSGGSSLAGQSTTLDEQLTAQETAGTGSLIDGNTFERIVVENVKVDGTKPTKLADGYGVIYFQDGTSIIVPTTAVAANAAPPESIFAIIDTNGEKGPNQISSCTSGGKTPVTLGTWNGDDNNTCAVKGNRFIKDRFMVRLTGTQVLPVGAASNYVFKDKTTALADGEKSGAASTPNPNP